MHGDNRSHRRVMFRGRIFLCNFLGCEKDSRVLNKARAARPCLLHSTVTRGADRTAMIMRRCSVIRATEDGHGRPTAGPALVVDGRQRPYTRNPLLDDGAILQHVFLYASGEGYLFLGGVSTSWRGAWEGRPKVTPLTVVGQSLSCLMRGVESGCRFGGKAEWYSPWNKMSTCVLAARSGDIEALRYARRLGCIWSERACATAALEGHLEVIQWSRAHGCPWDALTCAWAARRGHLRVLQWCRANGCPWDEMTCIGAAAGGHLGMLEWCRANGCPWGSLAFAAAAGAGNLHVLEWCKANGCPWFMPVELGWHTSYIIHPQPFEFVSWLSCFTKGQLLLGDSSICAVAAKEGHLEVLQWCRANDCRWNEMTCAAAASRGHLQVLQWCRGNGCPWDSSTCASAARGGHLELLIWCRARGCPWNEATCEGAARHGHLDVLQWCRANGCRWDEQTWKSAINHDHLSVLQWCKVSGCPTPAENGSIACESLRVLRWLHDNDLIRVGDRDMEGYVCQGAGYGGNLEVLQWLRAEGCPWTKMLSINAAKSGRLEILKWCTGSGCPWNARRCLVEASSSQQLHVIRWLEERRWSFLARFPKLHRSAMLATQQHLYTCGVVAGACALSIGLLAPMLDGTSEVILSSATCAVIIISFWRFHNMAFAYGYLDATVVIGVIFGVRDMITSPNWNGTMLIILAGVAYAFNRRLVMKAMARRGWWW